MIAGALTTWGRPDSPAALLKRIFKVPHNVRYLLRTGLGRDSELSNGRRTLSGADARCINTLVWQGPSRILTVRYRMYLKGFRRGSSVVALS